MKTEMLLDLVSLDVFTDSDVYFFVLNSNKGDRF